jgi:hypothetical protein
MRCNYSNLIAMYDLCNGDGITDLWMQVTYVEDDGCTRHNTVHDCIKCKTQVTILEII